MRVEHSAHSVRIASLEASVANFDTFIPSLTDSGEDRVEPVLLIVAEGDGLTANAHEKVDCLSVWNGG